MQRDRERGACKLAITAIRCARYIIGSQARFRNLLLGFFLFQILQCRYFSVISKRVRKDYNHFRLPNLEENVPWNLSGLVDSSTVSKISIIKIVFDRNVRIYYFARSKITGWLFS